MARLHLAACAVAAGLLAPAAPATAQTRDLDALGTNLDQILQRGEFNRDFRNKGVFRRFDRNSDSRVTAKELTESYGNDPHFEQCYTSDAVTNWDNDQSEDLDEDEFSLGVYDRYDQDKSGGLDPNEFGAYASDTGAGGMFAQDGIGQNRLGPNKLGQNAIGASPGGAGVGSTGSIGGSSAAVTAGGSASGGATGSIGGGSSVGGGIGQ
jgi:hypothetical protein